MNYKQLTVSNYKVSYYFIRIFSLLWLILQYNVFQVYSQRPNDFYEPSVWLQKLFFPTFPSALFFYILLFLCAVSLVICLLKPSVIINVVTCLLIAVINLPLASYHNIQHHNHLLVLGFFLSIFLIPKKLKEEDYKYIQYYQLGLLLTYSLSGFWKLVSVLKDFILKMPNISWIEPNAAKLNTFVNYHIIDQLPPNFIIKIYDYTTIWVLITVVVITIQAFSFLGAFSRKYLTFVMIFLMVFHLYNIYFVIAGSYMSIIMVAVFFFPYHYFKPSRHLD